MWEILNNVNFRNDKKCDLSKYSRNHNYLLFDTSHNNIDKYFLLKLKMKTLF